MALYLVQHGKSLPENLDIHKGLSEEGIAEVKRIAEVARQYGIKVSKILHSGKTRRGKQLKFLLPSLMSRMKLSKLKE
jgi:phosphohistidine phosphatase